MKIRQPIVSEWKSIIKQNGFEVSENFDSAQVLANSVEILNWNANGLPHDYHSAENALIYKYSEHFSLFLDPQGQATKWIKNNFKEKLAVLKTNDKDFARNLENSVRFGKVIKCFFHKIFRKVNKN